MAKHFSLKDLLRFTAPSVGGAVFVSIYGIVDGLFVSNCAGTTAFAAVNLIMPFIMILGTIGFMVGTGGSALVGKARGEGDDERANRWFSLLVYASFAGGVVVAVLGAVFMRQVAAAFGATGSMLDQCVLYGRLSMISLPAFILQFVFQSFSITAGKPKVGFAFTFASGVVNMVGDAVLVGALGMGVAGAAWATVASELLGGFGPIAYFASPNSSCLRLGRTRLEWRVIGRTCVNGSSEMMANIAMSVVSIFYNLQLIAMLGENGVAAYGVIMYVAMIFASVFEGYALGSAPLMSYQYGAKNKAEMASLWRKGMAVVAVGGVAMLCAAQAGAGLLAWMFTGYDADLSQLTEHAFRLYSIAFALMGFSMFGSSLFTSLNNGVVSAVISFVRSLVFEVGSVMLLPCVLGTDGIWLSVVVAEVCSVTMTFAFMFGLGKNYGYLQRPPR